MSIAHEPVAATDVDFALRVKGVAKSFGAHHILTGINLDVPRGQFLVVVGPSGCGKSTLLNLVAGFERPTAGTITMDGTVVSSKSTLQPPNKRDIGMIFQSLALWPHMSVYENVEFPLRQKHADKCKQKGWSRQQVLESLELVGLNDHVEKMPHQLSGGQQQRVALARALVTNPGILLMDEPLSSLDTALRERMSADIRRIQLTLKNTVLYVTHDQREAMTLADNVVVMNSGFIEQTGAPEDVYRNPKTPFVAQFVSRCNIMTADVAREIAKSQRMKLDTRHNEVAVLRERVALKPFEAVVNPDKHAVGRIISRQFLGKSFEYTIELNEGSVLVSHFDTQFDAGRQVVVEVESFQTFDA